MNEHELGFAVVILAAVYGASIYVLGRDLRELREKVDKLLVRGAGDSPEGSK